MEELLEKLKDEFVELADNEFPKGVSRERGQAMVLIAMCLIKAEPAIEAYIAERVEEVWRQADLIWIKGYLEGGGQKVPGFLEKELEIVSNHIDHLSKKEKA